LNIFKVTLADGRPVSVVLTPQDRGWLAQVGERQFTLRLVGSDGVNRVQIEMDGETVSLDLGAISDGQSQEQALARALQHAMVERAGLPAGVSLDPTRAAEPGTVESPMAGIVLEFLVQAGQIVESGQPIAIVEAMKMENRVKSTAAGVVSRLCVGVGDTMRKGDPLLVVSASAVDTTHVQDEGGSSVER
jgi:biotin carboxyl carrier protein